MSDDVVWQLVREGFCAFRKCTDTKDFCSNAYNVTGLCNRASCPLANSNYATVIEDQGTLFLCMKTAERCHTPSEQWERLKLSKNLETSLNQISEATKVGIAEYLTEKCHLRLKRWREVLQRMRRQALIQKTKLVPIKKKTERREKIREKKAEIAARLDNAIEQELLNRLSRGTYGELYQFEQDIDGEIEKEEDEEDVDYARNKSVKRRAMPHMEIEYEEDYERDLA
ncbi:Ribosomal L28e family protein [Babesia bovis T2Bo]|uniref:Protein MAK16 homolog n=1 Tax=Babesia bovis TaxID=5865 RepID=A7AMC0_BABBO|nr:Ribosomal L28e family protein [Babesia bovis T2Bo]EDO07704.1 Ribosomal L28e family protein [Babesia bovis T2Bo]BAN65215.1 Mak16 family protein [Babesia bovis]BAN65250.1 Mak16 family protein [Babesia bovis]|eukprot:XP_001611272.1 Mak16 family protein [Babesia bovis T2Bo]